MIRFVAKVREGYVHNRENGTSRVSRWVNARDIPLFVLDTYGTPKDNVKHPHNVQDLAWDFGAGQWRIVRGEGFRDSLLEVTYDGAFKL